MPEDDIGPYKRHELLTGEIYYPALGYAKDRGEYRQVLLLACSMSPNDRRFPPPWSELLSALPPKRTQIGQLGFIDCLPIATVAWAARATGC
jgi:hypothetical protein